MAMNFPTPAVSGDVYTADNGITYTYDGTKWIGQIGSSSDIDIGNWAFRNNTIYNLLGGEVNNGDITHGATAGVVLPSNGDVGAVSSVFNTYGDIQIQVANIANSATTSIWQFGTDGVLTLPEFGDIKDSNGSSVLGGGNTNTGNVVFDGNQMYVGGTGFLNLENSDDQVEIGSNNESSLIISTNEGAKKWEFDNDGWLSFPGTFPGGAIGYDEDTQTLQLARRDGVSLYAQAGAWVFGANGSITFPDSTVQSTAFTGILDLVTANETAPETGTLWFNTEEARMYVKYNEQWVDASPTVLAPPDTNPTLESVTFNDSTVQTTAWAGTYSYNDLTDKPESPTFVGGGGASTWLTPE